MTTVKAPGQPVATWPRRIGRILLTLLSLVSLGLAAALLLFTLVVLPPAWDCGIESLFVWLIAVLGLPLLAVQLVFGIILLLLRRRLAPLRAAMAVSALATLVSLGVVAGLAAYYVHAARLSGQAEATDAASLLNLQKAVQAGDARRAATLLDDLRMAALLTGQPAADMLCGVIDRKDRAMLAMLLEKGPSLPRSACPWKAPGPLHHAAAAGDLETARLLVEKGFAVNHGDAAYKTPLTYARENGRTEVAELLASCGGVAEDRAAMVLDAAARGDGAAVRRLVADGVDAGTCQGTGRTLLHYAAAQGDRETAELLLRKGADVSARSLAGETPLHLAARHNHAAMVRLLASKGADLGAESRAGGTPLDYASEAHCAETAKLLEELAAGRKQGD